MTNDFIDANRRHWDEVLPLHMKAWSYDVPGFKAGRSSLKYVELEELGDVRGKTLLHMQCHFGMDTISWAREGAVVTGADFSAPALEAARALAAECGIEARFVHSNVYELPDVLHEQFDIVFTSYGVLCWLPDVPRWARIAAHFVRPGGTFYIAEFHPFSMVFDDAPDVTDLHVRFPYFPRQDPLRWEGYGDYTDRNAKLQNDVTYEWPHPTSEVLSALIDAGLRIEHFHEFPLSSYKILPVMELVDDRYWRLTVGADAVPLVYSIKATKPE